MIQKSARIFCVNRFFFCQFQSEKIACFTYENEGIQKIL